MQHLLDNPVWHALAGPHQKFAVGSGRARHYQRDVSPFSAVPELNPEIYADLKLDYPQVGVARLVRAPVESLPHDWECIDTYPLVQMVCEAAPQTPSSQNMDVRPIERSDVDAVMELVRSTQPGPFEVRTIYLGNFWGAWKNERLIALAGERFSMPGYVEVSGVCTSPEARGQGLATLLVGILCTQMQARGSIPFLHIKGNNQALIDLYAGVGFKVRTTLHASWLRPKGA